MNVATFIDDVTRWAQSQNDIAALALVGSHARGDARPDSDIDLVILCLEPERFLTDTTWVSRFGAVVHTSREDWGTVQSVRVRYRGGLEVEFGITTTDWGALPADLGTVEVLRNGASVLLDREGSLRPIMRSLSTDPQVRPLDREREAAQCAQMMVTSEPWITLRLPVQTALQLLKDPAKEVHGIRDADGVAAFTVVDMRGLLMGYVQILCVRADCRRRGLGTVLLRWAEERIFRDSANVFICVSSFNAGARGLYERLGFEFVGVLRELLVPGHDEILLRKTRGTWSDFRRSSA